MLDPKKKGNIFNKLEPINIIFLNIYKTFWQPSSSLIINKCMAQFRKYAKKKIIIPTKPIFTGFKG